MVRTAKSAPYLGNVGSDLLLYLQGTEAISILGPAFTPLARIDLPDFGDVMPRILRCGRQK